MYTLESAVSRIKGVGPQLVASFAKYGIHTVGELLLHAPLRYEDRSQHVTVKDLVVGEVVTLTGQVIQPKNFYKGKRSIQSATFVDETGKIKLMWFNNPHVVDRFRIGATFLVSGKLSERGTIIQPTVEVFKEESIHTGRLVPIYSTIPNIAAGTLRKILKEVVDQVSLPKEVSTTEKWFKNEETSKQTDDNPFLSLHQSLQQLHFPDNADCITRARERLAIEELLELILRSHALKEQWRQIKGAVSISVPKKPLGEDLPFQLTHAQTRSLTEILEDLQQEAPMNRLLLGDVGSGKTAVAGLACQQVLSDGLHACLITPTQILAEQHAQTFHRLFPTLQIVVVTQQTSSKIDLHPTTPTLFIGTHALLPVIEKISPVLLIYDEQHRFGVKQRSIAQNLSRQPHILTLTATPIPRTLLLTIFSHLSVSIIDKLPPGRKPVKTWFVPSHKRVDGYRWIAEQLRSAQKFSQALVVCPFIDPSHAQALENVAAATQLYEELRELLNDSSRSNSAHSQRVKPLTIALLHGRMNKKDQQVITQQLFAQQIDVLVTTPIIEVGLDLPAADIIVIEAAERFGLASLHQLRGRVGRAGQQAYCLLMSPTQNEAVKERLTQFSETHNGLTLAEQDLQRRGAGDIFGTQQHGLDQLQFANWTNLQLITDAKYISGHFVKEKIDWHSPLQKFFHPENNSETIPLAN